MRDNTGRIIQLLKTLVSSPQPAQNFETPESQFERHQQVKHRALQELAQLQRSNPAIFRMLRLVTQEMPSDGGTRDQVLRRVRELAASLLPAFLRAQGVESGRTSRERFLDNASNRNPFHGPDVNLTIDSYVGQFEIEADTWAEGVNLER